MPLGRTTGRPTIDTASLFPVLPFVCHLPSFDQTYPVWGKKKAQNVFETVLIMFESDDGVVLLSGIYMLPSHLKDANITLEQFKSVLKTWLFVQAYT